MGAKYSIGRPTQEVRLRNWPAGRAAQFKKAIELLETQLNQTMAAQVDQGAKRVLSPRVPKVTGLSVRAGFKNFQINFLEAKGISDLLFYEIQRASAPNFADPTDYRIPQTSLTIPTDGDRQIVYFRVRCVNSRFDVGPWSATVRSVGSSNFRIATTRTALDEEVILSSSAHDTWTDVASLIFNATASNVSLHIHAGVHAISLDYFPARVAGNNADFVTAPSISVRILKNGEVMTFGYYTVNAIADASRTKTPLSYQRLEGVEMGTMVTPFETFAGDEGTVTYTIQAKVLTESFTYDITDTIQPYIDDVAIRVDVMDLMEVISGS